jgi:hypothetical protein
MMYKRLEQFLLRHLCVTCSQGSEVWACKGWQAIEEESDFQIQPWIGCITITWQELGKLFCQFHGSFALVGYKLGWRGIVVVVNLLAHFLEQMLICLGTSSNVFDHQWCLTGWKPACVRCCSRNEIGRSIYLAQQRQSRTTYLNLTGNHVNNVFCWCWSSWMLFGFLISQLCFAFCQ